MRLTKQYVGKAKVADYFRAISDKEFKKSLSILVKAEIKHNSIIQTAHVVETIAKVANKGFDLVVIGKKGRRNIIDLLIGSVAQRVLSTYKKTVFSSCKFKNR